MNALVVCTEVKGEFVAGYCNWVSKYSYKLRIDDATRDKELSNRRFSQNNVHDDIIEFVARRIIFHQVPLVCLAFSINFHPF